MNEKIKFASSVNLNGFVVNPMLPQIFQLHSKFITYNNWNIFTTFVLFFLSGKRSKIRGRQRKSGRSTKSRPKTGVRVRRRPPGRGWTDFVCGSCGKSYNRLVNLQRHERVECGNKEKTFHCQYCERSFYHRFELKGHMFKLHKIPKDILEEIFV